MIWFTAMETKNSRPVRNKAMADWTAPIRNLFDKDKKADEGQQQAVIESKNAFCRTEHRQRRDGSVIG
jgi:hypothetical protein